MLFFTVLFSSVWQKSDTIHNFFIWENSLILTDIILFEEPYFRHFKRQSFFLVILLVSFAYFVVAANKLDILNIWRFALRSLSSNTLFEGHFQIVLVHVLTLFTAVVWFSFPTVSTMKKVKCTLKFIYKCNVAWKF